MPCDPRNMRVRIILLENWINQPWQVGNGNHVVSNKKWSYTVENGSGLGKNV